MDGERLSNSEIPYIGFPEFMRMPNLLNEPDSFAEGELLNVSEKIHGSCLRLGVHPHPDTGEPTLYVGSHRLVLRESGNNLYWQAVRKHIKVEHLPLGVTFYGEVYGKGIQDLHYDSDIGLRVFAAFKNGRYLAVNQLVILCNLCEIPVVTFTEEKYGGLEWARELADAPSSLTKSHIREGVVLTSSDDVTGHYRSAKVLGMSYMTRMGKKTERH